MEVILLSSIISDLKGLRDEFNFMMEKNKNDISEEKIRSGYLNKLLELFGWNLSDTTQVIEEKKLNGRAKKKLNEIRSPHLKPDYQLLDRGVLRLYLDAKTSTEDFTLSKSVAFQIRSYGWSSELDISIVSNFGMFGVYDTTFRPSDDMQANYRAIFFSIDDLINDFELYSQFFLKDVVQKNAWKLSDFSSEFHEGDSRSLDEDFLRLINSFRLKLGTKLAQSNPNMTKEQLNFYVQVIINRIIFVRVLEDLGFEPFKSLYNFLNNGKNFWIQFQEKSKQDFWRKYDGALFTEELPTMTLPNDSFSDFIMSLYTNSPYKFNVIKPSLIAEIYDTFLGNQLSFDDKRVILIPKLLSPIGSIPTPSEVADYICRNTINLDHVNDISTLLSLKIIDPCVGSGAFLVSSYELLSQKYKELKRKEILSYNELKSIVINCLYGVDIDELALEVLKMTISLRLVTSNFTIQEPIENLLSDFSNNFRLGNTIVQDDAVDLGEEKDFQIPTNYNLLFPNVIKEGGFSHLVANPPYIEPKHFKSIWPNTLTYLKEKYVSSSGKADISLFFIERFFSLIRKGGQIGFITQNRFFKTEYGVHLQKWLGENQYLKKITEFQSNKLFKGKTTYVACLFGSKEKNSSLVYSYLDEEVNKNRTNLFEIMNNEPNEQVFSSSSLLGGYWSRTFFNAEEIINRIYQQNTREFTTFNKDNKYDIIVGPQVLDSKFFILKNVVVNSNNTVTALNRLDEEVVVEREMVRKVLRNNRMESFENFDNENMFSYIIFPYAKNSDFIEKKIMESKYPLTYEYLLDMSSRSTTKKRTKSSEFYRFTREQNHDSYFRPKVFFPMTHKRIVASFCDKEVFGDNSNVNALVIKDNDVNILKATCVIMNSKIFSLLAIAMSGDASGNYRKLNKQFAGNVIFPILTKKEIEKFEKIHDEIFMKKNKYDSSYGERRIILKKELAELNDLMNTEVNSIYQLKESEIVLLENSAKSIGIKMSEIDWM